MSNSHFDLCHPLETKSHKMSVFLITRSFFKYPSLFNIKLTNMNPSQIKSNSIPGNREGLLQISEINMSIYIYLAAG